MVTFAKVRPWKQSHNIHEPHKTPCTLWVYHIAHAVTKIVRHHSIPPGRVLKMRFIKDHHDVKVLLAFPVAWVHFHCFFSVETAPAYLTKLTLFCHCEIFVILGNESGADRLVQRLRQIFF